MLCIKKCYSLLWKNRSATSTLIILANLSKNLYELTNTLSSVSSDEIYISKFNYFKRLKSTSKRNFVCNFLMDTYTFRKAKWDCRCWYRPQKWKMYLLQNIDFPKIVPTAENYLTKFIPKIADWFNYLAEKKKQ